MSDSWRPAGLLSVVVCLFPCFSVACHHPAPLPVEGQIVLLHTNDMHTHFEPNEAPWIEGKPSIGGWLMIDAYARTARRDHPGQVLLMDAGDILTGTPLSDIKVDEVNGGAMLHFLDLAGYDAYELGNHEFDRGWDNVAALVKACPVPVLAANLKRKGSEDPAFSGLQPSVILEAGGLRVGVVGIITEELDQLASPETMARIDLRPIEDSLRLELARLDPQTDLLVVLSHAGVDKDKALAAAGIGADIIVGGHSHTALTEPLFVNGTWVVQAGSGARSIGQELITVRDDQIVSLEGKLVDLVPDPGWEPPSAAMVSETARWTEQIDLAFGEVVSQAVGDFHGDGQGESPMGMWVTDVLREVGHTDLAFYNGGGVRADFPTGTLTARNVFDAFPFTNPVVTFQVSGKDLATFVQSNAQAKISGERHGVHVSGLQARWTEEGGNAVVREILVGSAPIDPARVYTGTTTRYLVEQSVRYLGFTPSEVLSVDQTVYDVALAAARRGPVLTPTDQRFIKEP